MSELTHRWADEAQSMIARSDGAFIPADPANGDYARLLAEGVEIAPYQRFQSLQEAQAALLAEVEARAGSLRYTVAGTSDASKLAVYQTKYETAVAALAGNQTALAALAPEAAARSQSASDLAALVKGLGDQWRAAGLAIDAAYQTHKAAILALTDLSAALAYDAEAGWPG